MTVDQTNETGDLRCLVGREEPVVLTASVDRLA